MLSFTTALLLSVSICFEISGLWYGNGGGVLSLVDITGCDSGELI